MLEHTRWGIRSTVDCMKALVYEDSISLADGGVIAEGHPLRPLPIT